MSTPEPPCELPMPESADFNRELGGNLRRLREAAGRTQDEVTRSVRAYGLKWDRVAYSAVERGAKPLSVFELAVLVSASNAIDMPCDITTLCGSIGNRHALTPITAQAGEAELNVVHRLGIAAGAVLAASQELWGRTVTAERDNRLLIEGATSTARGRQAKRGHITRALIAEIKAHVAGGGR